MAKKGKKKAGLPTGDIHPTHDIRMSDSSVDDEKCENCGAAANALRSDFGELLIKPCPYPKLKS